MKIQMLEGGFANQIREYVFARFAERRHPGEKWCFDDSYFFTNKVFNGYELESVFGLKLDLLSYHYSPNEWKNLLNQTRQGLCMPQALLASGKKIVLFEGKIAKLSKVGQVNFSGMVIKPQGEHLGFHPEYTDVSFDDIYYHATWASRKWFDAYAEENRKELQFPILTDKQNLGYAVQIDNCYSVGIHVRRGDFQTVCRDLPAEAYNPACRQVIKEHPEADFFIFSDDLDWCRSNEKALGFNLARNTIYVEGNTGKNSYIDMQLLSMCKGMIRNAESSFSQVAGWLNPDLEFEIKIRPEPGYPFKIVTM